MLKSHSPNVKQCQCFNFKKIQQELHNLKAGWLGKLSIMLTKLPLSVTVVSVIATSVSDSGDSFVTFTSCYPLEILHDLLNAI